MKEVYHVLAKGQALTGVIVPNPLLDNLFNIGERPCGVAIDGNAGRMPQERRLLFNRREPCLPKAMNVIMGDMGERHGKTLIEPFREVAAPEAFGHQLLELRLKLFLIGCC